VVVGAGVSLGFGGFDFECFSGFSLPCLACDGGTAGVAGVAGLGFGGRAGVAGIAGVARSWVSLSGFGLGVAGGGDAEGSGALATGGDDGVPPEAVPPLGGDEGVGVGVVGVGAGGVVGVGAGGVGEGFPGDGGDAGVEGVPPPDDGLGEGAPTLDPVDPFEAAIGMKPPKSGCAAGFCFTTCGRAGDTSTGTLRTCVLGTASSRVAERSLVVKACTQSWADATAPAATAPT
jgi:hypothetical protein